MSQTMLLVWWPDGGETEADARRVEAYDASDAAEKLSVKFDCDEPVYEDEGYTFVTRDSFGVLRTVRTWKQLTVSFGSQVTE